jgi:hypothetical protein
MTVELGGTYSEPGATSNGGETVTITGSVDTDTLGSSTPLHILQQMLMAISAQPQEQ